ncbi:MAG: cytochrome c-type biogenesis protein CcmH [Nevskiales bacterium]|nr:cytochrome c-type biogenesis protein CcmH [Nevskiales bacterium]
MNGLLRVVAAMLLLAVCGQAAAQDDLAPPQQERYRVLINELRCLVCQNQTIADSNAPLAADLRDQVHAQIVAGRSDAEIIDYVTARYGDFVLYRPPFKRSTWLLWVGPFALLAVGLVGAMAFLRRRRRDAVTAQSVDPERLREILEDKDA